MSTKPPQHRFLVLALGTLLALAAIATASATKHTKLRVEQEVSAHRRLQTTLADAPSLRLQFTLKRASMKIYDQSEFYVFANPVVSSDNTTVLYDGYAAFMDGTTDYTFMLVNGISYFVTSTVGDSSGSQTAQCLSASLLPPLNSIISAINDATAISSAAAGNDTISCSSGDLFQATLGDASFVLFL
ncbi:hypothetical protein PRIC1_004088 [Phytophthora ramorum]